MKFYLNKLSVLGCKNINKKIEIHFSNIKIDKNFNFTGSNVKAIFGPNGSGKSAIVTSMYIYKNLLTGFVSLDDSSFLNFVKENINKETKKMEIEVIFSSFLKSKKETIKHIIEVSMNDSGIFISKEALFFLKENKTIKEENFIEYFSSINGKMETIFGKKTLGKEDEFSKYDIYSGSLNLLKKESIISIYFKNDFFIKDKKENPKFLKYYSILNSTYLFSHFLVIEIDTEDMHFNYIFNKNEEFIFDEDEKSQKKIFSFYTMESIMNKLKINKNSDYVDIIFENEIENYNKKIKKLIQFIKIFKPSLDDIEIDKKDLGDYYVCEKKLKYGNILVNLEFESTGIKKIVKLFDALNLCANGRVVFIDEMDANLHGVYFNKLIEFFIKESKGQLCFTTHNLYSIDVLKNNKYSIEFLSSDSRISSWTKNGNNSPYNKYINGLIDYSPFLVDSFDYDVLLDED